MQALVIIHLLRSELERNLPRKLTCLILYFSTLYTELLMAGMHRWSGYE